MVWAVKVNLVFTVMEVCLFSICTAVGFPPPPPPPPPPPQPINVAPNEHSAKTKAKYFMAVSPKSFIARGYPLGSHLDNLSLSAKCAKLAAPFRRRQAPSDPPRIRICP